MWINNCTVLNVSSITSVTAPFSLNTNVTMCGWSKCFTDSSNPLPPPRHWNPDYNSHSSVTLIMCTEWLKTVFIRVENCANLGRPSIIFSPAHLNSCLGIFCTDIRSRSLAKHTGHLRTLEKIQFLSSRTFLTFCNSVIWRWFLYLENLPNDYIEDFTSLDKVFNNKRNRFHCF